MPLHRRALAVWALLPLAGCGETAPEPSGAPPERRPAEPAHAERPAGPRAGEPVPDAADPAGLFPLPEGRRQARARGLPLLVLVGQPGRFCPPADRLRHGLCADASLDDVCVRTTLDGAPGSDPDGLRLLSRVRASHPLPPVLVVATPDLEILHIQAAGLMPVYDLAGGVLPLEAGPLLAAADVRRLVKDALGARADADRRLVELAHTEGAAARLAEAEILARRGRWEEALGRVPEGVGERLTPAEAVRLYDLLQLVGEPERAQALAARAVAYREAEHGTGWLELRLSRDAQGVPPERVAARLAEPIARAQAQGWRRLEAALRALRLRRCAEAGVPAPAEDRAAADSAPADLFKPEEPEGAWRLTDLAEAAARRGDVAEAERWALALLARHPGSPEAIRYRHGALDALRRGTPSGH